jgi:hypothetical protein
MEVRLDRLTKNMVVGVLSLALWAVLLWGSIAIYDVVIK